MARAKFEKSNMGEIVEVPDPQNPGLPGNRNAETLRDAFPNSPIYSPAGNAAVREFFEKEVMEGEVLNGFGFSSYNRDFTDAPNIEGVEKDENNQDIASPFAPNVAAPNSQATAQERIVKPTKGSGSPFPSNESSNPSVTSRVISSAKLGDFGLGKSSQG
tara:strand:- start:1938 stop:2417 length:480 start_codon:yes stop_codon:yes gene_type:complete